jgi:hypothetical protein
VLPDFTSARILPRIVAIEKEHGSSALSVAQQSLMQACCIDYVTVLD